MQPQDLSTHYQQVETEAANWLYERDEGLSPERERAFLLWLNQDPLHRRAFDELTQTVALLEEMPVAAGAAPARARATEKSDRAVPSIRRWTWFASAAAAAAALALTWNLISAGSRTEIYQTDTPQPRRLALADGSVVDLNGHSRLEVTLEGRERRLTLAKGEAHFQVAHDATRPFIVTANQVAVRAVGTAFGVKLADDKVSVLVVEGRVQLADSSQPAADHPVSAVPLMAAGDQAEVVTADKFAPRITQPDPVAMRAFLAWQVRLTNFEDVPLREIVNRINRGTGARLVIADEALAQRRIGGVIALDQVEAFLEFLQRENEVVVERNGEEITLRRMQ
jgi:transmembrane sensor